MEPIAGRVCRVQVKVGGLDPEEDARRVEARVAAGPDFILAVERQPRLVADDAVRFARLSSRSTSVVREPCHWYDDAAMMARVRQATRIPITAVQSEITSHGVRRLSSGAVDSRQCGRLGVRRVPSGRRAAALCGVACADGAHEESQISQHLLAAVRTAPTPSASPTRA